MDACLRRLMTQTMELCFTTIRSQRAQAFVSYCSTALLTKLCLGFYCLNTFSHDIALPVYIFYVEKQPSHWYIICTVLCLFLDHSKLFNPHVLKENSFNLSHL